MIRAFKKILGTILAASLITIYLPIKIDVAKAAHPALNTNDFTVTMKSPGSNDEVSAIAGAVAVGATVNVYDDVGLMSLIGTTMAVGDGSVAAFSIGDNQADLNDLIYITADDGTGASPAISKTNDTTPPSLVLAMTSDTTRINVKFSENVKASSVQTTDFTIANPVRTVSAVNVSGDTVFLTLNSAIDVNNTPDISIGGSGINDMYGNKLTSSGPISAIDGISPTVSITSPTEGRIYNSNRPLLEYTVSGATSTIVKVDGRVVNKVSGQNLDLLSDGAHQVRVEVSDGVNPIDQQVDFAVDTTKPSSAVKIKKDVYGPNSWDPDNTIKGTLSESITPPGTLSIYLIENAVGVLNGNWDGNKWTPHPDDAIDNSNIHIVGKTWKATVSKSAFAGKDGSAFTVKSIAKDAAGNIEETGIDTFVWDATPPTLTVISPQENETVSTKTPEVKFEVSETATAYIWVDIPWSAGTGKKINSGDKLSELSGGEHKIALQAIDLAGNESEIPYLTFSVDTSAPANDVTNTNHGKTFALGDTIVFDGYTELGAKVIIEVWSEPMYYSAFADDDGYWRIEVPASDFGVGKHLVYITTLDKYGNQIRQLLSEFEVVESLAPVDVVLAAAPEEVTEVSEKVTVETKEPTITQEETTPEEGEIKGEEEEEGRNWSSIITVIAIIVIALGVGTAGYYGYDWWVAGKELEEKEITDEDIILPQERPKKAAKKKGKRTTRSDTESRW